MSPIDTVEAALTAAGCGPKRRGSGLDARCPAHDDRSPSLTVSPGTVHPVVFHCHAGCDPEDVRRALGIEWAELCEDRPDDRPTVVAEYPYHDAEGTLVLTVRRLEPGYDGKAKTFTRSPKGAPSPLYRLPTVLATAAAGGTVWLAEGEKDADALDRAGATATCNPGGAGKFLPAHADALTGAHVVIVTDRDVPGYRHALDVFDALTDRAASVRIVEAVTGKDAADHLGAGHDLDAFAPVTPGELADRLAEPEPEPEADLEEPARPVLAIEDVATIAARVDATPPPQFIARPVWPADAYGVLAAENKAGKSWAALDLAVSVAAGTAWMGLWPCETPGPVLVFLGEGSERKTVRRLRAVAEFHGVRLEDLPIRVCHRSPKLADVMHLGAIAAELAATPAALVIVDPLYLSAGGANGASLYDMGEVLGAVQYVAQAAGAALVVVHHWNQTGTGKDRSRMSGAGPAEWGRVLVSVSVDERRTEPDRTSVVTLGWQIIGDEIPDTDVKVVRRVRATDPDDLASPMTYRIDPAGITADAPEWDGPKECMAAITAWFTEHPDEELSKRAVAERLRAFGLSYRDRTVGDALERLAVDHVLAVRKGPRGSRLFRLGEGEPLLELEAV